MFPDLTRDKHAGLEPVVTSNERPQKYVLDSTAADMGSV